MGPTATISKKNNTKDGKPSATSSTAKEINAKKLNLAEKAKSSRSEIDDIFSGRGEVATLTTTDTSTAAADSGGKKKKKKNKHKHKHGHGEKPKDGEEEEWTGFGATDATVDDYVLSNPSMPKVETVLDPSSFSTSTSNFRKRKRDAGVSGSSGTNKKTGKVVAGDNDEAERFRDSRGTGPRRKTEEGYSVYNEDELGLRDDGGDTPLCPFDCDCCF